LLLIGGDELEKLSKRLVAVFVVLSFFSVFHLSASHHDKVIGEVTPVKEEVKAPSDSPQIGVEREASSANKKKKSQKLLLIAGGVGILGVLALIIFSKNKKDTDLEVFSWKLTLHPIDEFGDLPDIEFEVKFSGSESQGNFKLYSGGSFINGSGAYNFSNNTVDMQWKSLSPTYILSNFSLSGKRSSQNKYSGNIANGIYNTSSRILNITGTWDATVL